MNSNDVDVTAPSPARINEVRPMPLIRTERKGRGWTVVTMAKKLRDAADDPQKDVPGIDSIKHSIHRWESGGCGVSERYRYLYCRVFGCTEWELFGIEPPSIASDDDGVETGIPYARNSLRSEKRKLRERMRATGLNYRQIAMEFSRVYRLRPRVAWREAYGWSLQDSADNINAFRGDTGLDPGGLSGMTSAHLCEYENWPGFGDIPIGRKPGTYLLAMLAGIYDCQVSDLIDLADRQHLSRADLLIMDTYTRRPSSTLLPADVKSDIQQGAAENTDVSGNSYVILALPPGTQRIVIDVTGADTAEESAVSQPVRRLMLVGE